MKTMGRQPRNLPTREGPVSPVHQQRPLGVDQHATVAQSLNAARVWFDVDNLGAQFGREPPGGLIAERPAPGDQTHGDQRIGHDTGRT